MAHADRVWMILACGRHVSHPSHRLGHSPGRGDADGLREQAEKRKLSTSGTKAELVTRLEAADADLATQGDGEERTG
ncbi:SAP domain-containing protein [Micromonospora sp. DPT]|uniref:SAP domain-containing protein n=1 Tax=Micromonospora sp. DPT TaxID=3142975 RepID=UPI0032087DE5